VTNDRRVFMDIKIEKSSQGDNVMTTEGAMFSINSNRTETKVLIADGETTVIGGIFIQETINDVSGVPGFSNIPIFGWLFKSKADTQRKKELMIFLTPRLVTI
jgi:type IV pilus assembly protein PilQ